MVRQLSGAVPGQPRPEAGQLSSQGRYPGLQVRQLGLQDRNLGLQDRHLGLQGRQRVLPGRLIAQPSLPAVSRQPRSAGPGPHR